MDVQSLNGTHQLPEATTSIPKVPPLTVRHYQVGAWSVVEAAGELDLQVVPLMHAHLAECPSNVVFDLRRVTFMDASGLGILASSVRLAQRARGTVRIVGPTRQVRKMLSVTQLDRAMLIFSSLEEAFAGAGLGDPEA